MYVEEPIIVEKAAAQGSTEDTGDVWILGMCSDMDEEGQSSLLVLDGARLADGPVARIRLAHHIPHGLHGSFAPGFHASKVVSPKKQP
jgi:all-trans-8'-apo-beta-carotenal 15,15'-oxygenase